MKILITGATGLIGSKLVEQLLAKNHTIHYLTTSKDKVKTEVNYKGFYWNPITNEIDINCFNEVETIIHLAGATIAKRWTSSYKKEIIDSRVKSSALLFNSLKSISHSVKHIISASGTAIYPESFDMVYEETTTETANDFLAGVVKKWEDSVALFEALSIKVSKLRTGVVFAQKGSAFQEMIKPVKFGFGSLMGNGNQVQSWIHIDDLVKVYVHVLEKSLEGIFNAVAPNPVTNKEFTITVAKKLKKPLLMFKIPQFLMKLVLGEMSFLLFSSKRLSAQKIKNSGFQFDYPTLESSLDNLLQ